MTLSENRQESPMTRRFIAVAALTVLTSLATPPAGAIEVAAYTPDPSLQPARQPAAAPLRVSETLAIEAMATLQPAREGASADLAALAEWNANGGRPTRVGFARALSEPLALRYDARGFAASIGRRSGGGMLARKPNGNFVWGTSVAVDEARALRLELAEVHLPEGARLWAFGPGGEARAFDLRLLRADGTLISPTISGDRIDLEVELPAGAVSDGQGFRILRVHEIALDFATGSAMPAQPEGASCLQSGECFDASDFPAIGLARQGVIQYLFEDGGFTYTCSGALIGDNDPTTLHAWFLTAHHCLETQANALTMDTFFFFRSLSCGSGSASGTPGPVGANLVATSATTDVSLVRALDAGDVPGGATYLGWTSARPGDGTVLHRLSHPVLDSTDEIQPQSYARHQLDETPGFICGGVFTPTNFLHSVNLAGTGIAPGSSGAPVMRADGIIVGQLYGACGDPPDGCATGATSNILDGALATSYPLLAPFLNPGSGGACVRDADTACLLGGRFKVEVTWVTSTGSGTGKVMAFNGQRAESDESAFFWFFNPTNFEMGVKMVDACVAPFNRFWVFFSGLTNQGFQVTVTRMSDGLQKVYPPNPVGFFPTTTGDTSAFACP
jgi:lysyl endopeptidase